VTFLALGCGDFRIPLYKDYAIVRTSGDECLISRDGDVVVLYRVAAYGVAGQAIYGRVDKSSFGAELQEKIGYFVIDTRSGMIWKGLKEQEMRSRLSSLGVPTSKATMVRPMRHQRWLRHRALLSRF
jgi:hypothetical protein